MSYQGSCGHLLKEPRNSICFFYPSHPVLADLTPEAVVAEKSLFLSTFWLRGEAVFFSGCGNS
jgi:hypothetical protein